VLAQTESCFDDIFKACANKRVCFSCRGWSSQQGELFYFERMWQWTCLEHDEKLALVFAVSTLASKI
jgi:hypothetical protein